MKEKNLQENHSKNSEWDVCENYKQNEAEIKDFIQTDE